jgi:serine protease Do
MRRLLVTATLIAALAAAVAHPAHAVTRASFAAAVKAAAPSVVNIYTTRRVMQRSTPTPADSYNADPLMNQLLAPNTPQRQARIQNSLGSGVIVDAAGLIVTNLHVIEGADATKVVLADGREFAAHLLNSDDKLDLAVLKIDAAPGARFPAARFGDSDTLQVGDVILSLGNPFGIGQSVSMGVVSAVDRSNAALSQYGQFIQTDASVNPGNSGGALIDSTGAVVGINTAIFSKSGGSQGISFAIPANLVRTVVKDIVTTGHVNRPWLGAVGQNVTPALSTRLGMPRATGVLVTDIVQGSPAETGGLRPGDVILAVGNKPITDPAGLNERIVSLPAGEGVPMTVWREGREQTLNVTFKALPQRNPADRAQLGGTGPLAGAVVEKLSPALNIDLDLPLNAQGVAVIQPPTTDASTPLAAGDVLLAINGKAIGGLDDAVRAAGQRTNQWQVKLQRGGKIFNTVLQ